MKKLFTVILTVAALFFANISEVLADGNPYGPYTPYQPHIPVPTGLEDTIIFYVAALVVFVLGMSTLATVNILEKRQTLK